MGTKSHIITGGGQPKSALGKKMSVRDRSSRDGKDRAGSRPQKRSKRRRSSR